MNGCGSLARMTIMAGEEYALKLSRLAEASEETAKKAVYAGAGVVADEIRTKLGGVLSKDATGALQASLGITPIDRDSDGVWNAKIGFDGYDKKGVPNQLKARAMESGTSTQPKHPFVRPAVNASRQKAEAEMARVVDEEIKKQMNR